VAKSKQKPPKTAMRNITKPLPVDLTDAEVLGYGREVARAYAERDRIQGELKTIKSDYGSKIDEQEATIGKLSGRVHSGIETRDVTCVETKNWSDVTVTVARSDTGETIEARPMREDEKAEKL